MYFLVLWKVEMAESHPTTFPFAVFVLLNFGNRMMIYSELYMCVYASQFYLYEFIYYYWFVGEYHSNCCYCCI